MANFHPGAVRFGKPGLLRIAPLGSTEPTSASSAWDAAWVTLGYTAEGSAFNYTTNYDDVEVAEELDPIDTVATGRTGSVEVALAEITRRNLTLAFNGGVVTGDDGAWTFEPPALGSETRVMLGWDSLTTANDFRIVFRRVLQVGAIGLENRKGATKSTIAANFKILKPLDGSASIKIFGPGSLNPSA